MVAAFRDRFGGPVSMSVVDEPAPGTAPEAIDWAAETALDPTITPVGFRPLPRSRQ